MGPDVVGDLVQTSEQQCPSQFLYTSGATQQSPCSNRLWQDAFGQRFIPEQVGDDVGGERVGSGVVGNHVGGVLVSVVVLVELSDVVRVVVCVTEAVLLADDVSEEEPLVVTDVVPEVLPVVVAVALDVMDAVDDSDVVRVDVPVVLGVIVSVLV